MGSTRSRHSPSSSQPSSAPDATHPVARHALRELLTDEVGHAQLGWEYLASLAGPDRASLVALLSRALAGCRAAWVARLDAIPTPAEPSHGSPHPDALRAVVDAAFEDLVDAGLAHVAPGPRG